MSQEIFDNILKDLGEEIDKAMQDCIILGCGIIIITRDYTNIPKVRRVSKEELLKEINETL